MVLRGAPGPAQMESPAFAALPVDTALLPVATAASTQTRSDGKRLASLVVAVASSSAGTTTLSVKLPMIKVNASVLKSIHGFGDMDDMLFKDKVLRRMAPGQLDSKAEDASDKISVVDAVVTVLGMSDAGARQWINKIGRAHV